MSRENCVRCGRAILGNTGRFEFSALDRTDATIAGYDGRLCAGCWADLVAFLEKPAEDRVKA